jgi:hypothetical protein
MSVYRWKDHKHRSSFAFAVDVEPSFMAFENDSPAMSIIVMHTPNNTPSRVPFWTSNVRSGTPLWWKISSEAEKWLDENCHSRWFVIATPTVPGKTDSFKNVVLFYQHRDAILFYMFWCATE